MVIKVWNSKKIKIKKKLLELAIPNKDNIKFKIKKKNF